MRARSCFLMDICVGQLLDRYLIAVLIKLVGGGDEWKDW